MNYQEVILTEEQLQERLAYWQKRLRLQDWIVQAKIVRMSEIDGAIGRINPNLKRKQALLRLTDPADYDPKNMLPYDMESVLVHELLHLHFYPLTQDQDEVTEEEQAIESLETALIALERELSSYRLLKVGDNG